MEKLPEFGSVHAYLNCAANFIDEMGTVLIDNPGPLEKQKEALEAITTVIKMLTPYPYVRCPKGQMAVYLMLSPSVRTLIADRK